MKHALLSTDKGMQDKLNCTKQQVDGTPRRGGNRMRGSGKLNFAEPSKMREME